jgi:hypothetical protein
MIELPKQTQAPMICDLWVSPAGTVMRLACYTKGSAHNAARPKPFMFGGAIVVGATTLIRSTLELHSRYVISQTYANSVRAGLSARDLMYQYLAML